MMELQNNKVISMCGILAPIVAYISVMISVKRAKWFRWEVHALSTLGARPESELFFNVGMMISGILLSIFAIGFFIIVRDVASKCGYITMFASGVSLFLVGFVPEDVSILHLYAAIAFYVLYLTSLVIIGASWIIQEKYTWLGILAIACSFFSVAAWLIPWADYGLPGLAIPEIISSIFALSWLIIISIKQYKQPLY